ncbi:Fatty acid desaturase [compost metagenome]
MKSSLFVTVFCIVLVGCWLLDAGMLADFALSLLLGVLLVGGLEFLHQCTHNNAFKSRRANRVWGRFFAALLFMNFNSYKCFHIDHHKFTGKAKDPERALYEGGTSAWSALLAAPLGYLQFAAAVGRYGGALKRAGKADWRISEAVRLGYICGFLGVLLWRPWLAIHAQVIPFLVFAWIDHLFNQAEHYGCRSGLEEGVCATPGEVSNDLLLPHWVGAVFLFRNLHRVHHLAPMTKWHQAPRVFASLPVDELRTLSFRRFLRRYFTEGARVWGIR